MTDVSAPCSQTSGVATRLVFTIAGFVEQAKVWALFAAKVGGNGFRCERDYHSSQPAFRIADAGFMARASTTAIAGLDDELEDVRWFTREDIASGAVRTPPPISISGCLIEDWYNTDASRPLREEPAARTWNAR